MWQIYEHRKVSKQLSEIPTEILQRYEKWKDIVRLSGPNGLKVIRGFNDEALDEALKGEWKGFRSSRLNQQYRVIYEVEREMILIKVVEVTPHDYRKK